MDGWEGGGWAAVASMSAAAHAGRVHAACLVHLPCRRAKPAGLFQDEQRFLRSTTREMMQQSPGCQVNCSAVLRRRLPSSLRHATLPAQPPTFSVVHSSRHVAESCTASVVVLLLPSSASSATAASTASCCSALLLSPRLVPSTLLSSLSTASCCLLRALAAAAGLLRRKKSRMACVGCTGARRLAAPAARRQAPGARDALRGA